MQKKTTTSSDRIPLHYYVFGDGKPETVLIGAPGMSIRFWLPMLRELGEGRGIVAFEYRGFPAGTRSLEVEEARFLRCLDDLERVLDAEGIERADFISWCAGTWLLMALLEQRPERIRCMAAVGVGTGRANELSQFEATMTEIRQTIDETPKALGRMALMMRKIGLVRDDAYFDALVPPGTSRLDVEDPPYMLFEQPVGLQSYLRLFHDFTTNFRAVQAAGKPLLLVKGVPSVAGDAPSEVSPVAELENTWELSLPQTSNFLLLERPRDVAAAIAAHFERHSRQTQRGPAVSRNESTQVQRVP